VHGQKVNCSFALDHYCGPKTGERGLKKGVGRVNFEIGEGEVEANHHSVKSGINKTSLVEKGEEKL